MFLRRHHVSRRARQSTRSIMALAGVAALLAMGFFGLSQAVERGLTMDVDSQLLLQMRETGDRTEPIGPRWLEEVGRDVTALGGVTVLTLIAVAATLFFWLASMRHGAVYVALVCLGGMALSTALKHVFERPRPDLISHGVFVHTPSFPSGHSTMAAAVYLTLGLVASRFVERRRLKALFIGAAALVTLAVGLSRVYLGVHWPTDVLAGWSAGTAWALVCWCVAVRLQDRGVIESEGEAAEAA